MPKFLLIIAAVILLIGCNNKSQNNNGNDFEKNPENDTIINSVITNRDSIIIKLENKIGNNEPLVIHVFLPMYGYNASRNTVYQDWADGTNPKSNLYWGAGYGLKTYFKRYDNWKLIYEKDSISEFVAERVVFAKNFTNKAQVYLIADAYFGYGMEFCLNDYFSAIWEENTDSVNILDKAIPANGNADLIVFNGHNGLLDYEIVLKNKKCVNQKETAIICCGSYCNFIDKIKLYHTFPLITTLDAIPAEAYILASIIEPWAMLKSDEEIRQNVMRKYISIHHCTKEDADRIFVTGFLY